MRTCECSVVGVLIFFSAATMKIRSLLHQKKAQASCSTAPSAQQRAGVRASPGHRFPSPESRIPRVLLAVALLLHGPATIPDGRYRRISLSLDVRSFDSDNIARTPRSPNDVADRDGGGNAGDKRHRPRHVTRVFLANAQPQLLFDRHTAATQQGTDRQKQPLVRGLAGNRGPGLAPSSMIRLHIAPSSRRRRHRGVGRPTNVIACMTPYRRRRVHRQNRAEASTVDDPAAGSVA